MLVNYIPAAELLAATRAPLDAMETPRSEKATAAWDAARAAIARCDEEIKLADGHPLVTRAVDQYGSDDISFDDQPVISEPDDGSGAWVSAWVWVANDEQGDDDE